MAVLSPQNVSPHGERPRSPAHSRPPNPLRYRLRDREKIKRVVSRMDSSDDDEIEDTLKRMPSLAWPGEDDVSTLSHGMRQMTTSLDNDATYVPGRGASSQGRKAPANAPKGKTKGGTGLQAWRILIRMLNNLFRRHHDKVKWKDVAGKINRYSEDDSRAFLKTLGLTPGEGPLPTWHSLTKDRVYEALAGGHPREPAPASPRPFTRASPRVRARRSEAAPRNGSASPLHAALLRLPPASPLTDCPRPLRAQTS